MEEGKGLPKIKGSLTVSGTKAVAEPLELHQTGPPQRRNMGDAMRKMMARTQDELRSKEKLPLRHLLTDIAFLGTMTRTKQLGPLA